MHLHTLGQYYRRKITLYHQAHCCKITVLNHGVSVLVQHDSKRWHNCFNSTSQLDIHVPSWHNVHQCCTALWSDRSRDLQSRRCCVDKDPAGSTQSKKRTVTGIYIYSHHFVLVNMVPCHIRDLHLFYQKMITMMNRLSEVNVPLFFNTEPDETDSGDDNNDPKNEGGQIDTTGQDMAESYPPLHRNSGQRRLPSPCHLWDQEIREEHRREDNLLRMAKQACLCLACRMNVTSEREREKRNSCLNTSI